MSTLTWLYDPAGESGAFDTLPPTAGMHVLSRTQLAQDATLRFDADARLCVAGESLLDLALQRLDDPARVAAVRVLKDKAAFRALLQDDYPSLRFARATLAELPRALAEFPRPLVLKPAKGCFGSGVRLLHAGDDADSVVAELRHEVARNAAVLSPDVLSADELLLESVIDGEEYAVDAFLDARGKPVITAIYHHPMPRNPAYLHLLYYTGRRVFERVQARALEFLERLSRKLGATRLPLHAEIRLDGERLVPIEVNPLRFGGMGLGHLAWHALGVDPYACFARDAAPDWDAVWHGRDRAYGFVIAYNGASADRATMRPDRDALRRRFSRVLLERAFDHRRQLAFGIYVVEEPEARLGELLALEFDDFFVADQGNVFSTA